MAKENPTSFCELLGFIAILQKNKKNFCGICGLSIT